MSDFDDIARMALLQNDISLEFRTEAGKQVLDNTKNLLREVERQFPSLDKYLTSRLLQEFLAQPDPKAALVAFMQEDRALIQQLENLISMGGAGRPTNAASLLTILENTDGTKLKAEVARIAARKFL